MSVFRVTAVLFTMSERTLTLIPKVKGACGRSFHGYQDLPFGDLPSFKQKTQVTMLCSIMESNVVQGSQ